MAAIFCRNRKSRAVKICVLSRSSGDRERASTDGPSIRASAPAFRFPEPAILRARHPPRTWGLCGSGRADATVHNTDQQNVIHMSLADPQGLRLSFRRCMKETTMKMLPALIFAAIAAVVPSVVAAEEDPRCVLDAYYAAIDRKDYRAAYLLWDRQGQASGQSFTAFRDGFDATAQSRVVTGRPVNGDAGMSQRWVDVPVDVHAVLTDGRRQHFRGHYTLHRVVPGVGASAEAERWHLFSARLAPVDVQP
ncbi:hypothetical protein WG924_26960 [Tistrella sp. 25B02-3]